MAVWSVALNVMEMENVNVEFADVSKPVSDTTTPTITAKLTLIHVIPFKVQISLSTSDRTVSIDCALCLYAAKNQNSLEDGSDFVVREECGNKCPDDFKDLQMKKDGSYVLKNAPLHFTEESKVKEEGNDMQRCTYMTIVDGESCTLEAFMGEIFHLGENSKIII